MRSRSEVKARKTQVLVPSKEEQKTLGLAAFNADKSEGVAEDYTGTELEVTWGKEHFQPIQYHGFDVGPFTMRTTIRQGETPQQANGRMQKILRQVAADEHEVKLEEYLERVRGVSKRMG